VDALPPPTDFTASLMLEPLAKNMPIQVTFIAPK
jgi:hypothetical protein